jgi:hypothetical protein
MAETIQLPHGSIQVEERPGYLLLVEQGTLRSVAAVEQYAAALEQLVQRTGLRRVLIDSRGTEPVGRDDGVREALWKWLLSGRAFDQMAFVLSSELQVTSVNMVALSERAAIRGFSAVHEAHRWLTGRQRTLSQSINAVTGMPTPVPAPLRPGLTESSRPTRGTGEIRRTDLPPRPSETALPARPSDRPPPAPRTTSTGRFQAVRPEPAPPPRPDGTRKSDVLPAYSTEHVTPPKKADET